MHKVKQPATDGQGEQGWRFKSAALIDLIYGQMPRPQQSRHITQEKSKQRLPHDIYATMNAYMHTIDFIFPENVLPKVFFVLFHSEA